MLVDEFGSDLKSDIVKVPHHGSAELFAGFPAAVAAGFAFVSSSGTHETFKHPWQSALDLYAGTAKIFCTCDAARKTVTFVATVNDSGAISVTPPQPKYFVWATTANGALRRRVITPRDG
jgi:beta-lactamase superfamily II metal-dependent hydrolase